ncbi:acetyl-CoA acetyltransferase [soil metagenome]
MRHEPGTLDPSTPVLIGVGTAHHVPPAGSGDDATHLPDPLDMMESAARSAIEDTGAAGHLQTLLSRISMVAVPEGNWVYGDPARTSADRLGCIDARTVRVELGVPQHAPIRAAIEGIAAGTLEAALIVGGEAKASQLAVQRAGGTPAGTIPDGAEPDERWAPQGEIVAAAEISAGIWAPVEQYACIDAALRHAEGVSLDTHLDQIADLWHGFNQVAATNPLAAFGEPRSREFLRTAGACNRPLAFPYAKWHSTQWAVDQAGAMVLTSVGSARELGVPTDRWVFPRVALESSLSLSLTKRADMHRWQAMEVLGRAAAGHLDLPLSQIEHVEMYSCFPAAVRVQQRALGFDPATVPTILGGMPFAGGPFNNFTYQSTAAIVDRVRQDPGSLGLVTTVSGLLTKPALAVWSTEPGPTLVADLGFEAAAATPTRDVTDQARGTGTIASYTVTYRGDAPASSFVIADLPDGGRWIGTSQDADLLSAGVSTELIGTSATIDGATCTL